MKKIEGTIFVECDVCWDLDTWTITCYVCGHTVCIICLRREKLPDIPRTSLWRLVERLEKLEIIKVKKIEFENQVELEK